jgi:hypothetical protein
VSAKNRQNFYKTKRQLKKTLLKVFMNNLRIKTKQLVQKEKHFTAQVIKNLVEIDRQKLFCDFGYPSLFKYLVRELHYSEAEANLRVGAVKLARKSPRVVKKISEGTLSLTNASQIQSSLNQKEKVKPQDIHRALELGENKPTRVLKEELRQEFKLKRAREERITFDERILKKIDRVKKIYGEEMSVYELVDTLLEEKLKTPKKPARPRNVAAKNSRYIPVQVKYEAHTGKCQRCGSRRELEYDHQHEYCLGGDNSRQNIQMLCRNCNQRKERLRQARPWPASTDLFSIDDQKKALGLLDK